MARSVVRCHTTLVPSGNAVGKSYLSAGLLLSFLYETPGCLVVSTAPTQTQLEEVLWKEVRRAKENAYVKLDGSVLKNPLKIDLGGGWQALGYSTTKTERLSGHHAADLFAVIDESSGVEPEIIEAIDSLSPSRLLMIGNPLRPDGPFYERCTRAMERQRSGEPDPLTNVIPISSLESPDITKPRSRRGLADATWLAKARNDYGEGSLWWTTHVLGLFPDAGEDTLIPRTWIDAAALAPHVRRGPTRTAIDLGGGNGGDRTVVLTRDDNGILQIEHSTTWTLEAAAGVAARQAQRWAVEHHRVTWDAAGIGVDFGNRLRTLGVTAAQPYMGGKGGGKRFGNLRSAAAWKMRQRLDPARTDASGAVQPPFSIRPEFVALLREELQGLRYSQDNTGRVCLEKKEDFAKRLRRSPDFADTIAQSFGFPDT